VLRYSKWGISLGFPPNPKS